MNTVTELLPAIDLRGGQAVRLLRGDYAAETVYSDCPLEVATTYEAAGARWIHVVDLDAARTGELTNLAVVASIAAAVSCRVEVGGGVRSVDAAERLFDAGVARVVIGTAAVEQPELVAQLCARWPGQVAVGLDARGRSLAVRGWTETTGADLVEAALRFEGVGVAALIVTEIGRDGTMAGPDIDQLEAVLWATGLDVIASGGVGTLDDLVELSRLRAAAPRGLGGVPRNDSGPGGVPRSDSSGDAPRSLAGVIVGKALYEGRFTVEEALACLAPV